MFPLLERDRLVIPYIATSLLYTVCLLLSLGYTLPLEPRRTDKLRPVKTFLVIVSVITTRNRMAVINATPLTSFYYDAMQASLSIMALVHALHCTMPPPPRYPHIYPLLYSATSAGFLGLTMLYTNALQWRLPPDMSKHQD